MTKLKKKLDLFLWILSRKDIEIEYFLRWKKEYLDTGRQKYNNEILLITAKEPASLTEIKEFVDNSSHILHRTTSNEKHQKET